MGLFRSKCSGLGLYSFTYFLPAPKQRIKGIQERSLDDITRIIAESPGIQIKDIKTESCADTHAGIWFVILYYALMENVSTYGQISEWSC